MRFTRLACLLVSAAVVGCGGGGGDDGGTTNPPPPPPPVNTQTLGSITTNPTSMQLVAGSTQTITVTAFDTQGAVIPSPGTPTFSVQQPTIADVDAGGVVVGISAGSTVITVSLTRGTVTRTATVTVGVTGSLPATANVSTTQGDVFTPRTVTIARGGTVTWTFGATIHNVTFLGTSGAPSNIPNISNTTESRTFPTAGNFTYDCSLHSGMRGEVVVR